MRWIQENSTNDKESYKGATGGVPTQLHYHDVTQAPVCPELIYSNYYRVLQTVTVGDPFRLELQLRGGPNSDITWTHNGESLANDGHTQIITAERFLSLEIHETIPSHSGLYVVRAENNHGIIESKFQLLVKERTAESSDDKEITEPSPPDTFGIKIQGKSSGCLKHPRSSVVLNVPEGAVPAGVTCTITGRIHTHLNTFSEYLPSGNIFVAPVVEYLTEPAITFIKPVQIKIRHCVANDEGRSNIKVYKIKNGTQLEEIPKGLKNDNGYYVEGQYIHITTNHFCHFLCHAHNKECKLVTTLNLFGSIQTTETNNIFTFRNLICLGCATLEEFQDHQRNALDPNMKLEKRTTITVRQLDNFHTARITLFIRLSESEWKFTDDGFPTQVHEFSFDNLDSINIFPIGDDYQIRTGLVAELPGTMFMEFCDENEAVIHSQKLKFTICPSEHKCKSMFGDDGHVLPLNLSSLQIDDTLHSSGTTEAIERYGKIFITEFKSALAEVGSYIDYDSISVYMEAWNICTKSQRRRIQEEIQVSEKRVERICQDLQKRAAVEGVLFAKALRKSDQMHCLRAILPNREDLKAFLKIDLEFCKNLRSEDL